MNQLFFHYLHVLKPLNLARFLKDFDPENLDKHIIIIDNILVIEINTDGRTGTGTSSGKGTPTSADRRVSTLPSGLKVGLVSLTTE